MWATSFRMRREDRPPSRFILSQTSAGNDCWDYVISGSSSVQFLGSCHEAVPKSGPALIPGHRAQGPSRLAVALGSPLARHFQATPWRARARCHAHADRDAIGLVLTHSNLRSLLRTAQAMRASLLASAIASTLCCSRFLAASIQDLSP